MESDNLAVLETVVAEATDEVLQTSRAQLHKRAKGPTEKTKLVSTRLTPEQHIKLMNACEILNITASDLTRAAFSAAIRIANQRTGGKLNEITDLLQDSSVITKKALPEEWPITPVGEVRWLDEVELREGPDQAIYRDDWGFMYNNQGEVWDSQTQAWFGAGGAGAFIKTIIPALKAGWEPPKHPNEKLKKGIEGAVKWDPSLKEIHVVAMLEARRIISYL